MPPGSWIDTVLGGIFNFTPEPTWAQVIGWLAYVAVTLTLYLAMLHRRSRTRQAVAPTTAAEPVVAN